MRSSIERWTHRGLDSCAFRCCHAALVVIFTFMVNFFRRSQKVGEERGPERSLEESARVMAARMLVNGATIDDLGFAKISKVRLREVDDIEVMRGLIRVEMARGARFLVVEPGVEIDGKVLVSDKIVLPDEQELSPDEAEATLANLEAKFKGSMYLHEEVDWEKVRASLEVDPKALKSVNKMQAAGHNPDVYDADGEGFDIGTCSLGSPESARNCVYSAAAAQWLKCNRPDEKFNGSAEEMAKAMGVELMYLHKYRRILLTRRDFDAGGTESYFLTHADDDTTSYADTVITARFSDRRFVDVSKVDNIYSHNLYRGWRGSLRVKWAA